MNNLVSVSGMVTENFKYTHEVNGEKFFTLKIKCCRASGTTDQIDVIVSGDNFDTTCNILGEYICVDGELRTHNIDKHLIIGVYAKNIDVLDIEGIDPIDVNSISLEGYLCRKSKLRSTPGGRQLLDCILAINRDYGHSDYVPVLFWGKNAELIDCLAIGTDLSVQGRFQSRDYLKDNVIHTTYEVSTQEFKIIV